MKTVDEVIEEIGLYVPADKLRPDIWELMILRLHCGELYDAEQKGMSTITAIKRKTAMRPAR